MFSYDMIQRFNQTDLKIYQYIIDNGEKIPFMTIRELASEVGYSTTTILRFCEKLNLSNYNEFKEWIRSSLKSLEASPPKEDLGAIQNYFTRTNTHSFEQKVMAGASIIRAARTVVFVGQGSSGTLARYGARYFSNLGKFSIGLEDTYYPITKEFDQETVVIALSVSGETKEIVEFIEQIKRHQVKVMSITNHYNSTIGQLSDWHIAYDLTDSRTDGGFNATTQVPVIFLMEALARRL